MGCRSAKETAVSEGEAETEAKVPAVAPAKQGDTAQLAGRSNEDIRDKYDLGRVLGSGAFGQVREAALKGSGECELRAVKMIERDDNDGEWSNQAIFVREVGLLQQIDHENIIRYFDFYEDVHFLYVVMELCKGGELFAKIVELRRFSETNAAVIGQQMLRAIDYIHTLQIVHRDIKAENFMLASPSLASPVKMIDFGMACKLEEGRHLTELCGSPHYLAPELIGQKYDHRADVWAFGVLMYLLMYGHYPCDAKHPRDIMVKILTEPIRWQTKVKLTKHALDFLMRTLEHDWKKRASAEDALNHPWMKLARIPATETDALPTEVIRSAHKKVTATRMQVDPKVEEARNEKLRRIDEDFRIGIRHGQRLGETPREDFMSKPEFVRRENKIATAPSRDIGRHTSLMKLIDSVGGGGGSGKVSNVERMDGAGVATSSPKRGLQAIGEADRGGREPSEDRPAAHRTLERSASAAVYRRRLSCIGTISVEEERNLASLFEEKSRAAKHQARLTAPVPPPLPGGLAPEPLLPPGGLAPLIVVPEPAPRAAAR